MSGKTFFDFSSLSESTKAANVSNTVIRAVVFDMDGLMFNTEQVFNLSGTELLRRRGKDAPQKLFHSMMGRRAQEAFQVMIDMMELSESIEELQVESEEIFFSMLDDVLAPMPGLIELLDVIEARNIPKAVATSSHRSYLNDIMGRFDLLHRFPHTLTAEDVTHGKPHPEIYLTVAARLNVSPHEMLVLEDSENGTKSAAAAGAHIISVPHEISRHQDFSSAKAIAESLHDTVIHELLG